MPMALYAAADAAQIPLVRGTFEPEEVRGWAEGSAALDSKHMVVGSIRHSPHRFLQDLQSGGFMVLVESFARVQGSSRICQKNIHV